MSVAISATIVITGLAVLDKEESITVLLVFRKRMSGSTVYTSVRTKTVSSPHMREQ